LSSAAAKSASPSSHSSFCEEVFSLVATGLWPVRRRTAPWLQRMRWSGRIFWLLASGSAFAERPFFPPSPPNAFGDWPWEVVSSYSSATAPGLHGISRADPLFQARKELLSGLASLGSRIQLQQRNCSRFTRDFSRRSTFSSSQRTAVRISGSRSRTQDLFRTCLGRAATNRRPSATIEQSAVRAASCSAKAWRIASRFSATAIAPER